jgi:Na+-transporting methylmalonyl-CoA/oxaloacetate decarboxylase beta subunit
MEIYLYGFPVTLIIIGVVQALKKVVTKRWIPIVSIIIGVAVMVLGMWERLTAEAVLQGIVLGLVSCGLWSSSKTILGK